MFERLKWNILFYLDARQARTGGQARTGAHTLFHVLYYKTQHYSQLRDGIM